MDSAGRTPAPTAGAVSKPPVSGTTLVTKLLLDIVGLDTLRYSTNGLLLKLRNLPATENSQVAGIFIFARRPHPTLSQRGRGMRTPARTSFSHHPKASAEHPSTSLRTFRISGMTYNDVEQTKRKPMLLLKLSGSFLLRYEQRALFRLLFHEPPRTTRACS